MDPRSAHCCDQYPDSNPEATFVSFGCLASAFPNNRPRLCPRLLHKDWGDLSVRGGLRSPMGLELGSVGQRLSRSWNHSPGNITFIDWFVYPRCSSPAPVPDMASAFIDSGYRFAGTRQMSFWRVTAWSFLHHLSSLFSLFLLSLSKNHEMRSCFKSIELCELAAFERLVRYLSVAAAGIML